MKKEEFIKQVTGLFSTEKFDDLNEILKKNGSLTLENKKLITTLNKTLGNDTVKSTLNSLTKQQKEETRKIGDNIALAISANDEKMVFQLLEPLTFARQFGYADLLMDNDKIFNQFLKNTVNNLESLTDKEVDNLKYKLTSSGFSSLNEDTASLLASKTNDVEFYIDFLTLKAVVLVRDDLEENNSNENAQQVEMLANKLYDTVDQHKHVNGKFILGEFFNRYKILVPYLSKDRIDRDETLSKITPTFLVESLINERYPVPLNYFLDKQKGDVEVSFRTFKNVFFSNKKHSKIKLSQDSKIYLNDLLLTRVRTPKYFMELIEDKDVLSLIKKQEIKLENQDLDHILDTFTEKEANIVFKEKNILVLDDNQKQIVDEFIKNPNERLIKKLCGNENFYIGDLVIKRIMDNLENDEFVSQLNKTAKDTILKHITDFSSIKDAPKFIQNFLIDIKPQPFNCFHKTFLSHTLKGKEEIPQFIFNNKVIFDNKSSSVLDVIKFSHFLSDENKKIVFPTIPSEQALVSFVEDEFGPMPVQFKNNLLEIEKFNNDFAATTKKKPKM